jgi:hypothetical protein
LGVRNSIHKKYATYEQAVANYQAALRDFNAPVPAAHPLPPDLPHVDALPGIPPDDGKAAGWKIVLIISLFVLLFGIWMGVTNIGHHCCPS